MVSVKSIICMISIFICSALNLVYSQKLRITPELYKMWPTMEDPSLCPNGTYAMFSTITPANDQNKITIKNTSELNHKDFINATGGLFFQDNMHALIEEKGTLFIVTLGSWEVDSIKNIKSFKVSRVAKSNWIFYQTNDLDRKLLVRKISSRHTKVIDSVADYQIGKNSNTLIISKTPTRQSTSSIEWYDVEEDFHFQIWTGKKIENLIFDDTGSQIVFNGYSDANCLKSSLYYYRKGCSSAVNIERCFSNASTFQNCEIIGEKFDKNNYRIYVNITSKPKITKKKGLHIWSYLDETLHREDLEYLKYKGIVNLNTETIFKIEELNERLAITSDVNVSNDYALLFKYFGDCPVEESGWNASCNQDIFLVNLDNGKRQKITTGSKYGGTLSPDSKHIVYFDYSKLSYFSYKIQTSDTIELTKNFSKSLLKSPTENLKIFQNGPRGLAGWIKSRNSVLIYDQYDIWELDLNGNIPPKNLTEGIGRKSNIVFTVTSSDNEDHLLSSKLLLCARDDKNMDNGFYELSFRKGMRKLTMGSYLYYLPDASININQGILPIGADSKDGYIVQRMSATESPNYFYTRDFIKYHQLSQNYPEKKYNWLSAELIKWQMDNGRTLNGILYKPENFDKNKKYPVIFFYYRKLSDGLNQFITPKSADGRLINSIPYLVSNGYIVCLPDIYHELGKPGEGALKSVISAAKYLSSLPYIDRGKLGIQGQSFGGFETNYIVTHTDIFSAACSSSGLYNLISAYGSINAGSSKQQQFESGPYQIGGTLWDSPNLYIENSPVFFAHRVSTPLLMMYTTADVTIPDGQPIEFFTALRRMGKKAWMLQYDSGNHVIYGDAADDFTVRMSQFFDHYLKGKPAPVWMTHGITAKNEDIKNGLEYDTDIKTPGPGLLNNEAQKMIDRLKIRKSVTN